VREALIERETLLRAMPHISWPMRFVLPYHKNMRFEGSTPTSHILNIVMPWMRGRRPAWLIRLGLFLYDNLGGRAILPGTTTLSLLGTPEGAPIDERFQKAYEYSDCWIEDSRLVVLNARDAEARGAEIMVNTKVISAARADGLWEITLESAGKTRVVWARMLVNAAGPWVGDVIHHKVRINSTEGVRLVRGSHIVTKKLYDHEKCYFFQGTDGRIIFAIPYETDFTLIGTTDAEHEDPAVKPVCTDKERDYLIDFANQYFRKDISAKDVVWSYSGVRPLYDDGASSATAATRDYTLKVDATAGAPILNIFGGKITTYRRLAESAMEKISAHFPNVSGPWTAGVSLPGGEFPVDGVPALIGRIAHDYPFLTTYWARRLVRAYGTEASTVLGNARTEAELGMSFGATLTAREVEWLMDFEYARRAEDVVWRRTKLGLRMTATEVTALDEWMRARLLARCATTAE
jgi:glycerol-3-phosphate dehydrogenase